MPLIEVREHSAADLERWRALERQDGVHAQTARFARRVAEAEDAIAAFVAAGPCYAGISWGKDSLVLAHLIARLGLSIPLVSICVDPVCNPHCDVVRDAVLAQHPARYEEIRVQARIDEQGAAHLTGTLEQGFAEAGRRHGDRYLSGVRGAESAPRRWRMKGHGIATERTCAPLGWWSATDVWAYLWQHQLPIHPAYAMGISAGYERDRLRVTFLGMRQSALGFGTREWECRYYPDAMRRIFGVRDPRDVSI